MIELYVKEFWSDFEQNPATKGYARFPKQIIVGLSPIYTVTGSLGLTLLSIQQLKDVLTLLDESDQLSPDWITAIAYGIGGIAYPIFAYRLLRSYRVLIAMINNGKAFWHTPADVKALDVSNDAKSKNTPHLLFPVALGLCTTAGIAMALLTLDSLSELYPDVSDTEENLFVFVAICSGVAQGLNWLSAWSLLLLPDQSMPARLSAETPQTAYVALILTLASLTLAIHRGQQTDDSFDTAYTMLMIMVLTQAPSIARGWGFLFKVLKGNVTLDFKNYPSMWVMSAAFYTASVFLASLLASHLLLFDTSLEELLELHAEKTETSLFAAGTIESAAASTAQCILASTGALSALGNRLRSLESAKKNSEPTNSSPAS